MAGSIFLDGDSDHSSTEDSTNTIAFTDLKTVSAPVAIRYGILT